MILLEEEKLDIDSVFVKTFRLTLNLFMNVLSVLTVFVSLVYASRSEITVFQLHIILYVLGYQFFMCQGTSVVSKFNSWSMPLSRHHKKHLHVVCHIMGLILVLIGSFLVINEKSFHFETVHGSLGIWALILSMISILNGISAYYVYRLSCINVCWIKLLHYVTGVSATFLSAGSLCYGFETKTFTSWVSSVESIAVLVIIAGIFTILATIDFWINISNKLFTS